MNIMPKGHFLPIDCHWLDAQGKYDEVAAVKRVQRNNDNVHKEFNYAQNIARSKIEVANEQRALNKELAEYISTA
tara:strand:+ start:456 stop:680 length:225 start_codon:yes stop_codon:yes gene_type:complete